MAHLQEVQGAAATKKPRHPDLANQTPNQSAIQSSAKNPLTKCLADTPAIPETRLLPWPLVPLHGWQSVLLKPPTRPRALLSSDSSAVFALVWSSAWAAALVATWDTLT